tara:strand:- start:657 stop:1274 length:618 start_codon:yes stop_codon:yes gene_type:complete
MNKTDNCSSGDQEAGLVNTSDFSRIPRNILKAKTPTNYQFSALTGAGCYTATTSTSTSTSSDEAVSSNTTTIVVTVIDHPFGAGFQIYKYTIEGVEWNPLPTGAGGDGPFQLSSGNTIIFDQSDSTNDGYDMGLWYLTAPDNTMIDPAANAYVNYTGTAGTDGAQLEVTHDATLYSTYNLHPGIGDTSSTTSQGPTGNSFTIEIL